MTNPALNAKKLTALLRKIGAPPPPQLPGIGPEADPLVCLVVSVLLWDASTEKARAAYDRLMSHVVDLNDLRVCLPHETLDMIGPRYPKALDRCQRLRAMLRDIYLREHAVSLQRLATTARREARKYLESLEGVVPYAANRVLVLCFETHQMPVDDQLRTHLIDAGVAEASVEIPELSVWLAQHIRAGDGPAAHYALQRWVEKAAAATARSERRSAAGGARRKSVAKG